MALKRTETRADHFYIFKMFTAKKEKRVRPKIIISQIRPQIAGWRDGRGRQHLYKSPGAGAIFYVSRRRWLMQGGLAAWRERIRIEPCPGTGPKTQKQGATGGERAYRSKGSRCHLGHNEGRSRSRVRDGGVMAPCTTARPCSRRLRRRRAFAFINPGWRAEEGEEREERSSCARLGCVPQPPPSVPQRIQRHHHQHHATRWVSESRLPPSAAPEAAPAPHTKNSSSSRTAFIITAFYLSKKG